MIDKKDQKGCQVGAIAIVVLDLLIKYCLNLYVYFQLTAVKRGQTQYLQQTV